MERMIDGDELVEKLRLIATCWSISPFVSKEKHNGAVDMLREVEKEVKEAPTLTPPNEWVSVEERLPQEKQRVIVRCERVGTSVGWILWGNWMTDIGPGAGKVTHWMPLPKVPKEEKKND